MIHSLNIGGGPGFRADGWLNLDEMQNVAGEGFIFDATCIVPLADKSVRLVYSSHTLEHLDDPTVARLLEESHRVLAPDGTLVIKIPDFDALLAAYRNDDFAYLDLPLWNMPAVVNTLANRGMVDSIATRTAWLFCGWWNREFGHLFGNYSPYRPGAYNGPPVLTQDRLKGILAMYSPHDIAARLREHVVAKEKHYTFNHQNAWSRKEFITLLQDHDFIWTCDDKDWVIASQSAIPGIEEMRNISYYVQARKGHG